MTISRGLGQFVNGAAWERRRWRVAGVVARRLPRDVVAQAVKRMVLETGCVDNHPLDVPVGVYTGRWAENGRR